MNVPKCDRCDKPATSFARGTITRPAMSGHLISEPCGEIVSGCDEHPPQPLNLHFQFPSEIYHSSGAPDAEDDGDDLECDWLD